MATGRHMSTLVWFRSDLRCDDHAALHAAHTAGGAVTGLFLIADATWQRHHWGARKQRFVWEHAIALRERLAALGVPLHILHAPRFADAAGAVLQLARDVSAERVLATAEYGADEIARDAQVSGALSGAGIGWRLMHDACVLAPGTVRTREAAPFKVYSPFRRAWLEQVRGEALGCVPAPSARTPVTPPALPAWRPPEADLDASWWPTGEDAAHARLHAFCEGGLHAYHSARDIPALDGTSRLSPYLATGVISVRRCLQAALAANNGEWDSGSRGAQIWINELIWREFYAHILQAFPAVSRDRPFRPETEHVPWRTHADDLARWKAGTTGFPLVDAAMRQLLATGWMHNRVRMLTGMFLSKHLLIDWRRGEEWFMEQLVDGELAANNGGWQWSASTGTDAAPYFRILSPERQAERFDADGAFVRRYVPEIAHCSTKALLKPGHPELLAAGYPAPMLDTRAARERVMLAFRAAGLAAADDGAV
jgi:deoxyribodipyrimidine photo-lyase